MGDDAFKSGKPAQDIIDYIAEETGKTFDIRRGVFGPDARKNGPWVTMKLKEDQYITVVLNTGHEDLAGMSEAELAEFADSTAKARFKTEVLSESEETL